MQVPIKNGVGEFHFPDMLEKHTKTTKIKIHSVSWTHPEGQRISTSGLLEPLFITCDSSYYTFGQKPPYKYNILGSFIRREKDGMQEFSSGLVSTLNSIPNRITLYVQNEREVAMLDGFMIVELIGELASGLLL